MKTTIKYMNFMEKQIQFQNIPAMEHKFSAWKFQLTIISQPKILKQINKIYFYYDTIKT